MDISNLIILGAGHFGHRALIQCSHAYPQCRITIVDRHAPALKKIPQSISCDIICNDGVSYLHALSEKESAQFSWMIPSIPIHVAFEWIKLNLFERVQRVKIPESILSQLPNAMPKNKSTVYMSYATFRCPDNCSEPADYCFVTKQARAISLFDKLQYLKNNHFSSIVMRSRQILPGLGGFQLRDLLDTLSLVESSERPILLSTACRCHGVMDAFEIKG